MGELLIRMVVSLAVVVGLLILISRVAARRFQGGAGSPVEVLHRHALSKTASVAVVSVGGRVLVLGTTEQQVNVLTELDADSVAAGSPTTDEGAELASAADQPLDLPAVATTDELPSLEALLAEPDLVTLEELFGHRPPATAGGLEEAYDAAPVPPVPPAAPAGHALRDEDPYLPEDPSYAAFASQLRAQLASGTHSTPAPHSGRHAGPAPALETPPSHTGGARAARPVPAAPAPAPVQTATAPAPAPVAAPTQAPATTGPTAADIAALRAALLAAQLQATTAPATTGPAPTAAPARVDRPAEGALAGSVLSPQTWRQAIRAVNRRAS